MRIRISFVLRVLTVYFLAIVWPFSAMAAQQKSTKSAKIAKCARAFLPSASALAQELLAEALEELDGIYEPKEGHGMMDGWDVDGADASWSYNNSFSPAFKKQGVSRAHDFLERFLARRKSDGDSTHILDIFGSGFFVSDLKLAQSITGIRFESFPAQRLPPGVSTPAEVLGDAFHPRTWEALDESMAERSIPSMDLIAMRPVGGWRVLRLARSIDGHIAGLKFMLAQVLLRLNSTGRYYLEIPLQPTQYPSGITQNPAMKKVAARIAAQTPYKLVLIESSYIANPMHGVVLPSVVGSLIPKD